MALTRTSDLLPAWPPRRLRSWLDRSWDRLDWPAWPDWAELTENARLRVEEYQEDGELVVKAELPGIDPEDDVEITVTDHTLRLRAQRRKESKTEDKRGYRSEFFYGSYARTLPLPAGAIDDDVKASYADGILEVRIPIDDEEAKSRKIPISRG